MRTVRTHISLRTPAIQLGPFPFVDVIYSFQWFYIKGDYRIDRIFSDRQAWANSVDPDETPQNAASHQGLQCLPVIQQFLDTRSGSIFYLFKF